MMFYQLFVIGILSIYSVTKSPIIDGLITTFPKQNPNYPLAIIMVPNNENWRFKGVLVTTFMEALKEIQKWEINPIIKNLTYFDQADSNCEDTRISLYYTVRLLMNSKPNVWFGPICDYSLAPIARLLPFWNISIVSPGGTSYVFQRMKNSEYKTLTRTGQNILNNHMKIFFRELFKTFQWKNVKYVYETTVQNYCRHIGQLFDDDKTNPLFKSINLLNINTVLETELSNETAIMVLCISPSTTRNLMKKALELNFVNGEYVFINIHLFGSVENISKPWYLGSATDEDNKKAKEAYRALLTVSVHNSNANEYDKFFQRMKSISKDYRGNASDDDIVRSYVGDFHDSLLLYALALNDTLAMNRSFEDGNMVTKMMWNRTFRGITGEVSIDENGDRNAEYALLDMNKETGVFKVVGLYSGKKEKFTILPNETIDWINPENKPPPDKPKCGFDFRNCPKKKIGAVTISLISMGAIILLALSGGFYVYRHAKFQAELKAMNWLISWDCIETKEKRSRLNSQRHDPISSFEAVSKRFQYTTRAWAKTEEETDTLMGNQPQNCDAIKYSGSRQNSINVSLNSWESYSGLQFDNSHCMKIFTTTAIYKGNIVALKPLHGTKKIEINKSLLIDVKKVKDLNNEHISRFIGVCLEASEHWILTEYCQKGSLQDILENEQINLDWMFKFSLLQDICRGMIYLHSNLGPHGNLKSSNCLVDSRFVLKISDFGLEKLRGTKDYLLENDEYAFYRHLLWTAPELLRKPPELRQQKTIKGDVYSFGIICQEVVYRKGVFYLGDRHMEPHDIIDCVKKCQTKPFRPLLGEEASCSEDLCKIIRQAWQEDFSVRPDFRTIKNMMRFFNKGGDSGNILDNLLSRMEQYANNLEELVNQRTEQYLEEKRKTEDLLYSMLPKSVAGQLIRNETVTAESFEMVSIYFSDIVGFTALSAESTPMQVIELLNRLYTTFDSIIESFDVYKVETIGDAYMVCSGLPQRNGNIHIREIARMSLAFLSEIFEFQIPHKPGKRLELRIGIHSGPVCAGVVGLKMPRYCLFGDTVNTASRMESNGLPLKIHLSQQSVDVLRTFPKFIISKRGLVNMKGKGSQTTYWLHGEGSKIIDPVTEDCELVEM